MCLIPGISQEYEGRRAGRTESVKDESGTVGMGKFLVLGAWFLVFCSLFFVPCSWFLVPCSLFLGPGSIAAGSEAVEAKRDALGRRPGGVVNAGVNFGGRINSDGVNCLRQTGTVSAGSTKLR